ncbi:Protein tyrosine kinase Protein kinase domain [Trypanosoma vivax]|uniref:Protein kinase domain-containing protein n=1 Tax=Trypanosoma vivax (strain Y486) TaxID=1055687 RepID=G0UA87_TRYVY|nr:putative protein kinase [Trypanosoma vivax]KAH8617939.1 Protein tyrosine kinase Protein kinase domain [Trypanosoma vivax]CCC52719.1 putative protein kinase [Trypanosoma vivax Y486]
MAANIGLGGSERQECGSATLCDPFVVGNHSCEVPPHHLTMPDKPEEHAVEIHSGELLCEPLVLVFSPHPSNVASPALYADNMPTSLHTRQEADGVPSTATEHNELDLRVSVTDLGRPTPVPLQQCPREPGGLSNAADEGAPLFQTATAAVRNEKTRRASLSGDTPALAANNADGGKCNSSNQAQPAPVVSSVLPAAPIAPASGLSKGPESRVFNFKYLEKIGEGGYGEVFKAMLDDGRLVAVKKMRRVASSKSIDREVSVLSTLPPHPHCVRYLGSAYSSNHHYIIMEYISGGSIASIRNKAGVFSEAAMQRYVKMVLLGLLHLHKHNIVHRDIKGANVLLDEKACAKIIDFGTCKVQSPTCETLGACGTPYWMSPEVCRGEGATGASDVWSVGCLCLEMTGKSGLPWDFPPHMDKLAILHAIADAKQPPSIPSDLTTLAKDFISSMLKINPGERPSVDALLEHPFLKESSQVDSSLDGKFVFLRKEGMGLGTVSGSKESRQHPLCEGGNAVGGGSALVTAAGHENRPWANSFGLESSQDMTDSKFKFSTVDGATGTNAPNGVVWIHRKENTADGAGVKRQVPPVTASRGENTSSGGNRIQRERSTRPSSVSWLRSKQGSNDRKEVIKWLMR